MTPQSQETHLDGAQGDNAASAEAEVDLGASNRYESGLSRRRRVLSVLGPRNISAAYALIAIIIIFTLWSGRTFASTSTLKNVLDNYSISGMIAISLILPLTCRMFDLSIGSTVSLTGICVGEMLANNWNPVVVALIGVGIGLAVGVINVLVVILLGIDSFIGTLATSSIIASLALAVSENVLSSPGLSRFNFSQHVALGLTLPVWILICVMLILGIVLDYTFVGRFYYATGFNSDSARLAGVPTLRIQSISFLFSGVVAAFAGVMLVSNVGAADPNVGSNYLIPAFAAAFLGATQFRRGRFNTWGTVLTVMLLGTVSQGLVIAGAPEWAENVIVGILLIAAVAASAESHLPPSLARARRSLRSMLRRTGTDPVHRGY
jgi:ribose transport system permease protein